MEIVQRALSKDEKEDIKQSFKEYNLSLGIEPHAKEELCWIIQDGDKNVIGALYGDSVWDWVHVDILFVKKEFRKQGIGRQLMETVEAYAVANSVVGIRLSTTSWQAPKFYEKLGYEHYATFDDYAKGHKKICFRKYL